MDCDWEGVFEDVKGERGAGPDSVCGCNGRKGWGVSIRAPRKESN